VMTEDEYYDWFEAAGCKRTGEGTSLLEEFQNAHGATIMVTRASELSSEDRVAAIERYKMYLGVGYPPYGTGAH
jgi:hypothetical protein